MLKRILFIFAVVAIVALAFGVAKYGLFLPQGGVLSVLQQNNSGLLPFVVYLSAFVDSLNPCAISVLLITIAFLFSLGRDRKHILLIGGTYIFGIFATYVLIGLGIVGTLSILNTPNFVAYAGAAIVIFWGLINLINAVYPKFPIKLKIPKAAHRQIAKLMGKGSKLAAFALGVFVGLTEFPCTGGPYLFVLGLLHSQTTHTVGLFYLVTYNLVFILPLCIILAMGSDRVLLEKVKKWKETDSKAYGIAGSVIMILLGLLILAFIH